MLLLIHQLMTASMTSPEPPSMTWRKNFSHTSSCVKWRQSPKVNANLQRISGWGIKNTTTGNFSLASLKRGIWMWHLVRKTVFSCRESPLWPSAPGHFLPGTCVLSCTNDVATCLAWNVLLINSLAGSQRWGSEIQKLAVNTVRRDEPFKSTATFLVGTLSHRGGQLVVRLITHLIKNSNINKYLALQTMILHWKYHWSVLVKYEIIIKLWMLPVS